MQRLLRHRRNNGLITPVPRRSKRVVIVTPKRRTKFHLVALIAIASVATWLLWVATPSTRRDCDRFDSLLSDIPVRHVGSKSLVKGGVLVFFHIAKTGGTMIRSHVARIPGVRSAPSLKQNKDGVFRRIETHLQSRKKQVLFVEFHGQGFPTHNLLEQHLEHWRQLEDQHGTPLFIFTVFREPLSYAVSYSNFFHKQNSVLQTASGNKQCWAFVRQGPAGPQECALVYATLLKYFDWVGATERIDQDTLPLLDYQLLGRHDKNGVVESHKNVAVPRNSTLAASQLSPHTVQQVLLNSCLDHAIWKRLPTDYRARDLLGESE